MSKKKALKIVCSAMLQSWRKTGIGPDNRYTEPEPTKTGITGMLACAMGYSKNDVRIKALHNSYELYMDIENSTPLYVNSEQDKTGENFMIDYQIVMDNKKGMLRADGGGRVKNASVRYKEYIVGHRFVLYIVAEENVLQEMENALNDPVWDYYLGSKCCVPSEPVANGIFDIRKDVNNELYKHIRS